MNRPGETNMTNKGEQKNYTCMMNTLKRDKITYTWKSNKKLLLKTVALTGLGFCAVLNALCLCGLFPPAVSLFFFQLRPQKHSAFGLYHEHSCLKRTYLKLNPDVCITIKSAYTYICFSNRDSIDKNWLTKLKSSKAV